MSTTTVSWRDTIKKEARGINGYDLGEVQEVGNYYVHTQKGIGEKTQFYVPKKLFRNYDGHTVHFDVDESNADQFIGNRFPTDAEYRAKYEPQEKEKPAVAESTKSSDIIERIPLVSERLDVSKHVHREEATITKVPVTQTQTREVPVTHEELRVEVRPASGAAAPETIKGPASETIKIPIEHEDVDVKKTPEVREEVVIRKTPVTETRRISEEVRSEKFNVSDNTKTTLEEERKKRATEHSSTT